MVYQFSTEDPAFARGVQLRHLRCLAAIAAEQGSLARAADRLALTQPAVSKTLAELERLAGTALLLRARRGARLTPAGEQLLVHARRVLDAVDAAADAMAPSVRMGGERLVIGALPSVAPALVPPAIVTLQALRPHLCIELRCAANAVLLDGLQVGSLDIVVARMGDPLRMAGLSFELLDNTPLAVLVRAGHPLVSGGHPARGALAALGAWPWIVYPERTIPRQATESWMQAHGLALPPRRTETMEVAVARALAQQSDGVWFTPAGAAADDLAGGRLVALPIDTTGTAEPVGVLMRSASMAATAAPLLWAGADALRAAAAGRHVLLK